jgi:hypothetical protein
VAADDVSVRRDDGSGAAGDPVAQELGEVNLADEADALAVLLVGGREAELAGEAAHLALHECTNRKARVRELILIETVQEVGLVLV